MKKATTLNTILGVLLINASLIGQEVLQQWTFEDPDGTELSAASNSGTGDWTFDTVLDAVSQITGGVLEIRGLDSVAAVYPAFASSDKVLTGSQFELSFDVPAFDLTGGDNGGANVTVDFYTGGSDPVTDPSTLVGSMRIRKNGGELKATLNNDKEIEATLTSGGATNTNGVNVVMNIDLSTDTYSASITGGTGIAPASIGPVSFDGGVTASQITQIRVRAAALQDTDWGAADYFQIDNLTLIGAPQLEPTTWAGYAIDEEGWIDTAGWLGWLNVNLTPWIWSDDLQTYLYIEEADVSDGGSWVYLLGN